MLARKKYFIVKIQENANNISYVNNKAKTKITNFFQCRNRISHRYKITTVQELDLQERKKKEIFICSETKMWENEPANKKPLK